MAAPAQGGGVPVYNPATGEVENHAPKVAAVQLKRGAVRPADSTIRIVRGNEVRETSPEKLAEAEAHGWALADDEGVRAAGVRADEDTFLGAVQGTGESFASGLTFGLSDLALREMGADPERMRARKGAAGDMADAARLGGEVLPVLFSGGSAAAARGGALGLGKAAISRAGALPRLVEGAGILAEKGVERALGTGLGARATGAFVRGGLEGVASGAGQEIHESVLGDRDIAAERVLMAGGMSGLFGGAAGAAFPLTGHMIRKGGEVSRDAVAKVMGAGSNMAPDGSIVRGLAATAASGKRAGPMLDQLELLAKDNPKLHRALHEQDAVVEEIGTRVRSAAEVYSDAQKRGVMAFERDRAGTFGELLGDTGDGQVARYVVDDVSAAISRLDDHIAHASNPEFSANYDMMALKQTRAPLAIVRDSAAAMPASQGYQELVKGLRDTQEQLARLRKLDKKPDTVDMLVDVERALKDALTSPKYGGAAKAFKEVSDADAAYFTVAEKMGNTSVGRLLNRGKLATNADAVDVVKKYGEFRNTDRIDAARQSIDADIAAMEKRVQYSKSPEMAAALKDMQSARKQLLGAMDDAAENAQILARQTEMGRSPMSGVLASMGPSGPAIVGGMLGGPIGAAIGGGLAMMARPGSAIRTMSAIKHAADKSGLKIDGIVKAITATTKRAKSASKRPKPTRRASTGQSKSRARTVATRVASRGDTQRRQQKRAAELADPRALEAELATEMFALSKAAPGVSEVMAERIALGAQFLASKLPPETTDPITGTKRIVDPETRDRFDRYHEAVTDPIAALERLESGTFTVEHAEAIREVWPALFKDVQGRVLEGLQQAEDDGEQLPVTRRIHLGILLGMPTHQSMTPEYQAAMMALTGNDAAAKVEDGPAAPPKQTRARKVQMKTPKSYDTPMARRERSDV